jgi:hypothetical protein
MKKSLVFLTISVITLIFFFTKSACAFDVTYLHPGYIASDFLTLDFPTASIEFDSDDNLYTEDASGWGTGQLRTAVILKLESASGYSTSVNYATFTTRGRGINGLDFDEQGSLFVSEFRPGANSGMIREIDTTTLSVVDTFLLPNFRPTGIAAVGVPNVYFPGRLWADPDFGSIYSIDDIGTLDIFLDGFVGTGISINESGKFFLATPGRDVSPLLSRSIYMLNPVTMSLTLIATFDDTVEELNFDSNGNLYALELHVASDTPKIIQISPTTIEVAIDIKPGSDPNSINLSSAGVIPVAILSADTFDATTVDPDTISLAGARVKMVGKSGKYLSHEEDVNGDGLLDLVSQVYTAQFMVEIGETVAVLEAETLEGTPIRGEDSINIVSDN